MQNLTDRNRRHRTCRKNGDFFHRLRRPFYQSLSVRHARRDLSADDERVGHELHGDRFAGLGVQHSRQRLQAVYGFVVPYLRRGVILGVGNCVLGLSVVASGFASSFSHFFTTRLIGGIGSSPQHPVGSSMLASHFGAARGAHLGFSFNRGTARQPGRAVVGSVVNYAKLAGAAVFWASAFLRPLSG